MNKPDAYYGVVAENYDRAREVKAKWKAEQAFVAEVLTDGPVLDVPFGTGRFVPVYRSKGLEFTGIDISEDMLAIARRKFPGVNASRGSIYELPFGDNSFGTVVCVRFLEWLPLGYAWLVLDRLRKIAPTLIISIVHGIEGKPEAYTYNYLKFLACLDGLFIADRRVTAEVRGMISEVFKLRPSCWADVVQQFRHDYPDNPEHHIQRLADKFAGFFGLPSIPVRADTVSVRAEYWTGPRLAAAVRDLADHRFITDMEPRSEDGPLIVIERDGKSLIIDGRKRANQWIYGPGPHPVLVLRP